MALQLDEVTDMMRFFLDGSLAVEAFMSSMPGWGTPKQVKPVQRVAELGVQDSRLLFQINSDYAGGLFGDISLADFRMYVNDEKGPLSAAEILSIAQGPTPIGMLESLKCLPSTSSDLLDTNWKDGMGRSCHWYFGAKKVRPPVCDLDAVATNCPGSCGSRQTCFSRKLKDNVYFAWDRLRLISPIHVQGSLCLGQDTGLSKQAVAQDCKEWLAAGGSKSVADADALELQLWFNSVLEKKGRSRPYINLTDCEELEMAVDESCDFDMQPIQDFTRDLKESNGYSIGFWVKPIGEKSLTDGKFLPKISLLRKISPPEPIFALSRSVEWTENDILLMSYSICTEVESCSDLFDLPCCHRIGQKIPRSWPYTYNQEMSTSDWTFIAISNHFDSADGFATQNGQVLGASDKEGLHYDGSSDFFKAIGI
jgi:hypothetical protein